MNIPIKDFLSTYAPVSLGVTRIRIVRSRIVQSQCMFNKVVVATYIPNSNVSSFYISLPLILLCSYTEKIKCLTLTSKQTGSRSK